MKAVLPALTLSRTTTEIGRAKADAAASTAHAFSALLGPKVAAKPHQQTPDRHDHDRDTARRTDVRIAARVQSRQSAEHGRARIERDGPAREPDPSQAAGGAAAVDEVAAKQSGAAQADGHAGESARTAMRHAVTVAAAEQTPADAGSAGADDALMQKSTAAGAPSLPADASSVDDKEARAPDADEGSVDQRAVDTAASEPSPMLAGTTLLAASTAVCADGERSAMPQAAQAAAGAAVVSQGACIKLRAGVADPAAATDDPAGSADTASTPAFSADLKTLLASLSAASATNPVMNPDPVVAQPLATPADALATATAIPLATASQLAPALPSSVVASPTLSATLFSSDPRFVEHLGERVLMLADSSPDGPSSARIELHPAELGSLVVHIDIQSNQAQVSFATDNPATRALLQQSLPQLRELMGAQGLQLLRTRVDERQRNPATAAGAWPGRARNEPTMSRRVGRIRLVDAYV